jgi:hypothetical protein
MISLSRLFSMNLWFASIFFIVLSCENEPVGNTINNNIPPNSSVTIIENFGAVTTGDFMGRVIDSQYSPVSNATVRIGNSSTATDDNGIFIIKNAQSYEKFAYIKVQKFGYIDGSRAVVPTSGINQIQIMLLPLTVTETVTSGSAETVSLSNGASVNLPGTYVNSDGSDFTGNVQVTLHFLNPTEEDMSLQMPGMLLAQNLQNEARILETLGMLAVELRSESGEELNLAEGSLATISVPLDPEVLSDAPNEIPLWYFDENMGYWVEEGSATLQGNTYVGTVSHFSFWNCDIPTEYINLCLNVTDGNSNPLSQILVTIESEFNGTGTGITNDSGEVCGIVPANQLLNLQYNLFNICNNFEIPNSAETIGPFTTDTTLNIVLDAPEVEEYLETITGVFNTCDGSAVVNGYVEGSVEGGAAFYSPVTNGVFEIHVLSCNENASVSISGYDFESLQTTGEINYTLTSPQTHIGTLSACDTVTEFIQYNIDEGVENVLFISDISADYFDQNTQGVVANLQIFANNQNDCIYFSGVLDDTYPNYEGQYTYASGWQEDAPGFGFFECLDVAPTNNNIVFNLNTFATNVGGYFDINFSGNYQDYDGNPHTITGVIHVIRDN